MNKPMTAADYRRNAEQKRAERPTEIVELKSGSIFELRRPDLQAWVLTGRVPQSLVEAGVEAWKKQGKVSADTSQQNAKMVTDAGFFFVKLVQSCTVSPRLVEFPDPEKNEIGPDTMLDEDFYEIVGWAMNHQGVAGIDGLQSFREGRERGTAGNSVDGPEQRRETVESVADR
jgi:hypothetical protein